jgi:hypothetical protein
VFDIFSVADSVSAKDGGSFAGNVGMGGTLSVTGNTTVGGTLGVTGAVTLSTKLATTNLATGAVVQIVNVQTGAVATGTTAIPFDDTIPQITEGDQFMTLAITPKSSSNKLKIDVIVNGASSAAGDITIALFVGTTANALATADIFKAAANHRTNFMLTHFEAAGSTSELTFRVRAGTSGSETFTFNGHSTNRLFGGTFLSSITITEIAV